VEIQASDLLRGPATSIETFAEGVLLIMLCDTVAHVTGAAAALRPPFAYRGSIAFDQLVIDDRFLLGPAIDEAAEAERLAEGAFVWLCPSAYRVVQQGFGKTAAKSLPLVPDYPVPMKNGAVHTTHVVNPFRKLGAGRRADDAIANLLGCFDVSRPDVAVKKQHTESFLREARRLAPTLQ